MKFARSNKLLLGNGTGPKDSHKASSIYAKYGPNFGLHLDMMDKRLRRI